MRKNHCSKSRRSTRSPERSQVPSERTCSLARTVWHPGHQFTIAFAVGEAGFQKAQKNQLVESHVLRIVTAHLAAPVVDGAEADHARAQLLDPRFAPFARMAPPTLDRRVLGREAERVESERREDPVALHRPEADERVAEGVIADVALVGGPTWVRVHAEHVISSARIVSVDLVGALFGPAPLPALFD